MSQITPAVIAQVLCFQTTYKKLAFEKCLIE